MPASVLVVEHGRLPSTDYYLKAHAAGFGVPVRLVDSRVQAATAELLASGTLVIFVRYIPAAWRDAIRRQGAMLHGVVCFIDDDLLDRRAWRGLPWRYRWKLRQLAPTPEWLRQSGAKLWVSTPYLAEKYRHLAPALLPPRPLASLGEQRQAVRIGFHGSAAHLDACRWLVPVIRAVQERAADTCFELFGDGTVNALFRDIPRVSVLHPMSWENYLAYCRSHTLDIGLAPRLPGPFNLARSTTKFFDISRCGAVGLYSQVEPFAGFIRDGVDGLLLPNEPHLWVEAIVTLAGQPERRAAMTTAARERADALSLPHG